MASFEWLKEGELFSNQNSENNYYIKLHQELIVNIEDVDESEIERSPSPQKIKYEDVCTRCKQIITNLKEEKVEHLKQISELSKQLEKLKNPCRCELKHHVELLRKEEQCLDQTIILKKENLENLKQAVRKINIEIDQNTEILESKKQMLKDINLLIDSCEKDFKIRSQTAQDNQKSVIELDKNIDKLKSKIKLKDNEMKTLQKKVDERTKFCTEIQKKHDAKMGEIDLFQKLFSDLDKVSEELKSKNKTVKEEIRMLLNTNDLLLKDKELKSKECEKLCEEKVEISEEIKKIKSEIHAENLNLHSQKEQKDTLNTLISNAETQNKYLSERLEFIKQDNTIKAEEARKLIEITDVTTIHIKNHTEKNDILQKIIEEKIKNRGDLEQDILSLTNEEKRKIKYALEHLKSFENLFSELVHTEYLIEKDGESFKNNFSENVTVPPDHDTSQHQNKFLKAFSDYVHYLHEKFKLKHDVTPEPEPPIDSCDFIQEQDKNFEVEQQINLPDKNITRKININIQTVKPDCECACNNFQCKNGKCGQ